MKIIKDVRQTFMPDFCNRPKTRDVQGVELGDVQGKTIQDLPQTPPDRSGEIAVITKED